MTTPRPMPAADEPARHITAPTIPRLGRPEGGNVQQDVVRTAARAAGRLTAPGATVVVVLALLAAAVYFLPPMRSASSEPVWTKADQAHFEAAIASQIATVAATLETERKDRKEQDAKQEAQMREIREVAQTQAISLARLVDLTADLKERVKALEARPPR